MHAFDLRYVAGREIVVRRAKNGETMMTLDGIDRTFTDDISSIGRATQGVKVMNLGENDQVQAVAKVVVKDDEE